MGNAKQISVYDMVLKEYKKVSSAENSLLVTNANGTLVSVKIDGMLKIMKNLVDMGNIYNIDSVQSICFKNDNFIFIGTEGGLVKKYSMN
ncbi:hypothetical protein THOM_1811 [Trachipleistophora hominis]|uniref:Uncharacterized protein n=1 Tax=Trachipleistophora hominis TaxID=72359 RepID=L7JUV4_TRAHO|nr:hypothetical protein THOM_1811 [Trachipleistophora hominis]